jgi:mono/diheme cytochrome c family protein
MPKPLIYLVMVLLILALIPPAVIVRTRAVQSANRRIHVNLDMDLQGRFGPQDPGVINGDITKPIFADLRAMRPPVEHTLSREDYKLQLDDHFYRGVIAGGDGKPAWATAYPSQTPVTEKLILRGQERFNIYCRPCHGYAGYGDGIVNERAQALLLTGQGGTVWVQPKSLHEPLIRDQSPGQLFNTITNGIRNMAGYASQIPVADRWAIVAYVKALQLSQHASDQDVPADQRSNMPLIKLPPSAVPAAAAPARTASAERIGGVGGNQP